MTWGTSTSAIPPIPQSSCPKDRLHNSRPISRSMSRSALPASRGLLNSDLNNFAPRIGLAWQFTPKTVLRMGYGIFYGGQENGPYSNPSPGFNPPFFTNQSFISPCGAPTANALAGDCRVTQIPSLANGFPANSLVDPNTPIFFSVDKNLRTPYMQQWHLSVERELPANSVSTLTYAGSKGTKLYTFFNGNQAAPDPNPNDATAPRRPVFATLIELTGPVFSGKSSVLHPVFDTGIDWFRSTGSSNYNSLQASFEKRFAKGLQFQASYTYAHSLDIASNANLGPTQNNSDFRYFRDPQAEYGNSDFDVRNASSSIRSTNCRSATANILWGAPPGLRTRWSEAGRLRISSRSPVATGTRCSTQTATSPILTAAPAAFLSVQTLSETQTARALCREIPIRNARS